MITSIEQITDELLQHGLLTEESLGETCYAMEKQGLEINGQNLLSLLTTEGKLTPFQAKEVQNGRANQLLLGNYLVLSKLGEGGMGTVFKAIHRRMQRLVAIKVIRKEIATRDFIARFRREIQLSARLNHPNIVIAYDSDQCSMGDFLVMEFVDGIDLGEIIKRTGPLSLKDAVAAIRQAALALGYAHQQGIVHRDIKPANLLRDANGCVKVVDLGLARVSEWEGAKGSELTQLGSVAGTVDYMSPEQAENPLAVDGRSDIYSLGCTLFALLTGGPVFDKSSLMGRLMAHRQETPPRLSAVRSDVPPSLDMVFLRMLEKSPSNRFATMDELITALDACAGTKPAIESKVIIPNSIHEAWNPQQTSVLIVESSRLQSSMIRRILTEIGVENVHICQTGAEALESLSTNPNKILLGSMRLSDMSGLELATHIRDSMRWLEIGILLMSSDDWTPEIRKAAKQIGRMELLKKPLEANALRNAIVSVLCDESPHHDVIEGLSGLRVLVVDDSSLARKNARKTLSELGFSDFTEAEDGQAAADLMKTTRFDLVVTDYHMPRMDGRQLITHIRQESSQREIPVIMVTTEFDPKKLAAVYQLGVSAICNKSFEKALVKNIVIQLFL
jgi:serine/threonine protein kinase